MHEFSLCRYLLETVEEYCRKLNYHYVKRINLEVGEAAAVDKDAMLFAFTILSKGSTVENSQLLITNIPGNEVRIKSMEVV